MPAMKIAFEERVAFFREHAGYSVAQGESQDDGRQRCAEQLARAELWLVQHYGKAEWEEDENADRSWLEDEPDGDDGRPLFGCIVSVPCKCGAPCCKGRLDASLWSIDLGPAGTECDDYKRVVVAELALELMDDE